MSTETRNLAVILGGALFVIGLGIFFFGSDDSQTATESPADKNILVRQGSHQTNPGGKVTVVEFGDYQCPACAAAYSAIKAIEEKYKDSKDFNFVFRNFPLPMHRNALVAAEAAEAAAEQGKFWEMNNALYEHQKDWGESSDAMKFFLQYAKDIGLNTDEFQKAVTDEKFADVISKDKSDGNTLGVDSTPTFYINGEKFVGIPGSDFKAKIENDLKQ